MDTGCYSDSIEFYNTEYLQVLFYNVFVDEARDIVRIEAYGILLFLPTLKGIKRDENTYATRFNTRREGTHIMCYVVFV